jgi:hypothetical protein
MANDRVKPVSIDDYIAGFPPEVHTSLLSAYVLERADIDDLPFMICSVPLIVGKPKQGRACNHWEKS